MEENKEIKSYEYNSMSDSVTKSYMLYNFNVYDEYNSTMLNEMIKDPMHNNQELRRLSQRVYNSNGIVTNTIDYMCALPTLDRVVVPYGNEKTKEQRKNVFTDALEKIRDKELARDCLLCSFIDGVAFYYLETNKRPLNPGKYMNDFEVDRISEINEDEKASVISLNPDYTRIVGIKNGSYVLAFNLQYFDENGGERTEEKLRKFPKEIRDAYHKYRSGGVAKKWVVLDNNHTIAIKFRAKKSEPWGRPLVLAALQDIMFSDYYTETKRGVLDEVNNRIFYETFPEGERKGLSALSEKQQQAQHNAVKTGITTKNNRGGVSFFSVAAGTKIDTLDTNIDLLDEKNETNLRSNVSTSMGFAGSLLSGAGDSSYSAQESNLRLVTSEIFHVMELFTNELNKVMNAQFLNGTDGVKVFYLPITYTNREKMVGFAKDMYISGRGSLLMWAAASGINPDAFMTLMDYEIAMDLENRYPVHKTSYNQGSGDSEESQPGRPVDEDSKNPKTMETRTNNGNETPRVN